jgi:hypothetical protein
MLGSISEAEDAVRESWLHVSRSDPRSVENMRGWLRTIVARVCLDMLRSRKSRREEPLGPHVPEPVWGHEDQIDSEHEAVLADSLGTALLVVSVPLGATITTEIGVTIPARLGTNSVADVGGLRRVDHPHDLQFDTRR